MKKKFVLILVVMVLMITGYVSWTVFPYRNQAKETYKKNTASEVQSKSTSDFQEKYESVYEKIIEIDNSRQKFVIRQNVNDVTDTNITLNGKRVVLKRVAIEAGYVHSTIKMIDVTGDGQKEIVMFLCGGASGSPCDVQIFGKRNGVWEEIPTPKSLWKEDNVLVLNHNDSCISVKVSPTNFVKCIQDKKEVSMDKIEGMKGLRRCRLKNGKLQIEDDVSIGAVGNKIGTVIQRLKYDKKRMHLDILKQNILPESNK